MLYCKGAVPLLPNAVMVPLLLPPQVVAAGWLWRRRAADAYHRRIDTSIGIFNGKGVITPCKSGEKIAWLKSDTIDTVSIRRSFLQLPLAVMLPLLLPQSVHGYKLMPVRCCLKRSPNGALTSIGISYGNRIYSCTKAIEYAACLERNAVNTVCIWPVVPEPVALIIPVLLPQLVLVTVVGDGPRNHKAGACLWNRCRIDWLWQQWYRWYWVINP